jgi:hypothetical protein
MDCGHYVDDSDYHVEFFVNGVKVKWCGACFFSQFPPIEAAYA